MKRILTTLTISFLAAMLFIHCDSKSAANPTCFQYKATEKEKRINFLTAKMLAENYLNDTNKSYAWNENRRLGDDAICAWYSLQVIKDFIYKFEDTIAKQGHAGRYKLGLRFYYVKYPSSQDMKNNLYLDSLPGEYAYHHGLMIVPTYWNERLEAFVDFDPGDMKDGPRKFRRTSSKEVMVISSLGGNELENNVMNHGGVSPPPKSIGTFGQ